MAQPDICHRICLPISGSRRIPMIATRDIAHAAADRLLDSSWTGRCVRELHGPADLSFEEAAAAISRGLGRPIVHVKVDDATIRKAMIAANVSKDVTDLMLELYHSCETGALRPAMERSPETYTPTRLVDFAREVIRPLIEEPAMH